MSTELLPVFPNRPSTVACNGCTVFVSIHDAEHLRQRRAWKRQIKDTHPDRGGKQDAILRIMRGYRDWLAQEYRWYDAVGVEPIRPIKVIGCAKLEAQPLPMPYPCAICGGPVETSLFVSARANGRKTCGRPWCKVEISHRQQRRRSVSVQLTDPARPIPAYVTCPTCAAPSRLIGRTPENTRLSCRACGHLW